MLAGKVERGDPKAKSNYMHKARAAGRNYHKDRAGIEDTKAREGREILYTWINLRYVSLGRSPRDSPTATGIRFCLLSSLQEWPLLAPLPPLLLSMSLSLLIIAAWISTSYALYACLLGTFFARLVPFMRNRSAQNNLQRNLETVCDISRRWSRSPLR